MNSRRILTKLSVSKFQLVAVFSLFLIFIACTSEVEVTRQVEVTREVEVTKEVEVVVTPEAPEAAPVPASAMGPAIPFDKGYLVEEIEDGLYWVTDGTNQAMFLTTGDGVIVVDAPPSIGENFLKAIAEVTDEPVTHFIYSHYHKDHGGGAGMFPDDSTYISHEQTAAQLALANDPDRPVPTVTFADLDDSLSTCSAAARSTSSARSW